MSSEWEEFCESNGCNAGSEEDNDYLYESLEEPRLKPNPPIAEIRPSVGRDELIVLLIDSIVIGNAEFDYENQIPSEGYYDTDCLDNWPDKPFPNLILKFGFSKIVPVSFLIDVMRTFKIPLLFSEDEWIAWDALEKCLKIGTPTIESLWHREKPGWPCDELTEIDREPDQQEIDLLNFLRRLALSTDHGMKPLLLHHDYLDEAMRGREVEAEEFRTIPEDAITDYVLVYCGSDGRPAWIPLKQAANKGFPICTRTGTYRSLEKAMVPLLSHGKMLVGAFKLATSRNPNEFNWFLARERVSVFQSAIDRIDGPPECVDFEDSEGALQSKCALYRAEGTKRTFDTYKSSAMENAQSMRVCKILCKRTIHRRRKPACP